MKRILVGIGGTAYGKVAIQKAIELAQSHQAELTVVTVFDVDRLRSSGPVPIGAGMAAKAMSDRKIEATKEKIEETIGTFEHECKRLGLSYSVEREYGSPFERAISLSGSHDLFVFGLQGLLEADVFDDTESVLLHMLSKGMRPVLAVAARHRKIERVMIAHNGSREASNAMKRFVQNRLWPDASLSLVHFDRGNQPPPLDDLLRYCELHGFKCDTQVDTRKPKALFAKAEEIGADLIVMGCRTKSRLSKLVFGDLARYAIKHATLPLYLSD